MDELLMAQELISDRQKILPKQNGSFTDYLLLARLDHSTKHIFVIPGIILAYILRGNRNAFLVADLLYGSIAVVCVASANYVINEWLDRDFDKYHPTKSARTSVQRRLDGRIVAIEWGAFITVGLMSAFLAGATMLIVACLFALQGIFYNVPPLRTKDKPYLDVISESVNNPLRLMIGWAMIDPLTLPPSSVILAYWLGGAFLMGAKRLSEYREIVASHGKELLTRYRASFRTYNEISLTVSCFVYGLFSTFFLAIFFIKYRIEYILLMPPITALFAYYLALSMQPGSAAQNPEKLFREYKLLLLVVLLGLLSILTTFINIPALNTLTGQRFIGLY